MIELQAASDSQSKSPAPAKAGAGHFKRLRSLRRMMLLVLLLGTSAGIVQPRVNAGHSRAAGFLYRDGPPPGFSGGFGEDHCQACHFGDKVNANPGSLTVSAPARYSPGQTYTVTIMLRRPAMAIGGFQLTARFETDSTQAGNLTPAEGQEERIKVMTDRGVQYAHHLRPGTQRTSDDAVRWTLRWTAPDDSRTVVFSAAANAANEDDSQFGDFVYTSQVQSRGR